MLVKTTDAAKANLSCVLERHVVDERIDLAGKHAHYGECRHIQSHACALLELELVDL